MKLTREQAIKFHKLMWMEMQDELGDNPSFGQRLDFKAKWCKEHFPGEHIESNCFLCEYCVNCDDCPIKWDDDPQYDYCSGLGVNYEHSPISEILALEERNVDDGHDKQRIGN